MNLKLTAQHRLEILKFLAEGHTTWEAAERWKVSLATIKRLKRSVKPLAMHHSNVPKRAASVATIPRQPTEVTVPTETVTPTEYDIPIESQDLEVFLWELRPTLVKSALEILDNPDKRTIDHLKALDLLAKWSGLNLGNEEKIQRQIEEAAEVLAIEKITEFLNHILEDTILSDSAKARLVEMGKEAVSHPDPLTR